MLLSGSAHVIISDNYSLYGLGRYFISKPTSQSGHCKTQHKLYLFGLTLNIWTFLSASCSYFLTVAFSILFLERIIFFLTMVNQNTTIYKTIINILQNNKLILIKLLFVKCT